MKGKKYSRVRGTIAVLMLCLVIAMWGSSAFSQEKFPSKTVTIICVSPPGGAGDTVSRLIASTAKEYLNQPVIVVNKVGGTGSVGHTAGATAKPDGYTVTMMTVESIVYNKIGVADVSYKDFQPLLQITFWPAGVIVKQDAPWNTLNDFVKDAKQNPEKYASATQALGGIWRMATDGLENAAGIKLKKVPFDGSGPMTTALLGGHTDITTCGLPEAATYIQAGKMRPLGAMSSARYKYFSEVPTLKEQGYDVVVGAWLGLGVPKGTPMDRCKILADAFQKSISTPQFKELMEKRTLDVVSLGMEDWAKSLAAQDKFYSTLLGK